MPVPCERLGFVQNAAWEPEHRADMARIQSTCKHPAAMRDSSPWLLHSCLQSVPCWIGYTLSTKTCQLRSVFVSLHFFPVADSLCFAAFLSLVSCLEFQQIHAPHVASVCHAMYAAFISASRACIHRAKHTHMPTIRPPQFIYGRESWIPCTPGFLSQKLRGLEATTEVELIPHAGHQLYGDQPDLCNLAILRAAARMRKRPHVAVARQQQEEREMYESN
jgi:pimeloyl-ACP methyl ester carboxylesterase